MLWFIPNSAKRHPNTPLLSDTAKMMLYFTPMMGRWNLIGKYGEKNEGPIFFIFFLIYFQYIKFSYKNILKMYSFSFLTKYNKT
jgi:hypothetical protein